MDTKTIVDSLRANGFKQTVKKNIRRLGEIVKTENELNDLRKIIVNLAGGENYILTDDNKRIIDIMIYYFLADNKILEFAEIDPNKGLMIIGKKGVGKTTLFNVFNDFFKVIHCQNHFTMFQITSTEKIKLSFLKKGNYAEFCGETEGSVSLSKRSLVINEFGIQYDCKHYGTSFNEVMNSILMLRYELFAEHGIYTHGTSNLDTEEMKNTFDPMLLDRLKEMFNIVELKGESKRK